MKPRYVRVNTLKMDVDSAVQELEKHYTVRAKFFPKTLKILMSFDIVRKVLESVIVGGRSSFSHSFGEFSLILV